MYVLSARGASDESARWLADRENAADLVGGVSLDDKDSVLASVLLDLSQGASMSASVDAAQKVMDELDRIGNVTRRGVKHAGFLVLKSPDIPSMLVETAFISNPTEEARLGHAGVISSAWRRRSTRACAATSTRIRRRARCVAQLRATAARSDRRREREGAARAALPGTGQ